MTTHKSAKDLLSGLIFIGFGVAFGYASLGYDIGTALRMGPGYFPILLSAILIVLGLAIIAKGLFAASRDETPIGNIRPVAILLILGAFVFFGVTARGLGLMPALFVTAFMSALASKQTGFFGALLLAAGLAFICWVIFIWALGLPLRSFGPWISF
jgi:hypothetical protein